MYVGLHKPQQSIALLRDSIMSRGKRIACCTMDTASIILQSSAPARAARGGVESGGSIMHLERKRSHGRGLPAQCSPGARSGAALPAGPKHTRCTTQGQRWSAALPRLGQRTLCSHPAFLRCACRDRPHRFSCCTFESAGRTRRRGQHARRVLCA